MNPRMNIIIIAMVLATHCTTIDGIVVDCSFGMYTVPAIGSIYACTARVIVDGAANQNVTALYGSHQTGMGHADVQAFLLKSQNLAFFPTNIESFFQNLIAINLYNNTINTVSNGHLIPFPNLQYLWLNINQITWIDGDLFNGLNSMHSIGFAANNIQHVGHDLNLPISGRIEFSINPCISTIATTPTEIATLKLNLLRNCPPTISQIEQSLEKRQNLLVQAQVRDLNENSEKMSIELATLRNEMNEEFATLRKEINEELASLRNDMNEELVRLRNVQSNLLLVTLDLKGRIEHLETIDRNKLAGKPAVELIDTSKEMLLG